MSGVNKVILIGRLGSDPQTNQTKDGNSVARISIATSESWKDKQTGEKREVTEWHRVVFFARLAEIATQYLRKGSQVYIEGKLKTSKYTDKEGIEKYSTDIICSGFDSKMIMLDSRSNGQSGEQLGEQNNYAGNQFNAQDNAEAHNQDKQNNQAKREIPDEMRVDVSDDLPF